MDYPLETLQKVVREFAADKRGVTHGTLLGFSWDRAAFDRSIRLYAPGCGAPYFPFGVHGGSMPCGATLKDLSGNVERQFCGSCREALNQVCYVGAY
jgi:hypothetical protein